MNMERAGLLAALNLVKPAVAAKPLVEALTHVWFDGKTMLAYDDVLGIQVPFEAPFEGGIPHAVILGLLTNSRAKELTIEPQKSGKMLLKAARARAELSLLDPDKSVWSFPAFKGGFEITDAFLDLLKAVLISVGNDTSIPEKQGVTLICGKQGLAMFTTDAKTIGRADLAKPKGAKDFHAIIPTGFCQQILRLCKAGDKLVLEEDHVVASNADGVAVYARLVAAEQPRDFFEIFKRELPDGLDKIEGLFEIPGRLPLALERAIVLLEGASDGKFEIKLGNGKMLILASAPGRGELRDDSVDIPDDVPEMTCSLDPTHIKRAIPLCTHMAFTNCLFMDDGAGFAYLAAFRGR